MFGTLHDSVVDGFLGSLCEGFRWQSKEIEIACHSIDGRLSGLGYFRFESGDLTEHNIRTEDKISAIPEITIGDVTACGDGVRLLHERLNGERCAAIECLSRLDVAVLGRGKRRVDTKSDDPAVRCGFNSLTTRLYECRFITDNVIGGEDENRRCRITPRREHSSNGHGHRRIATHRFERDVTVNSGLVHLLGDDEPGVGIRYGG